MNKKHAIIATIAVCLLVNAANADVWSKARDSLIKKTLPKPVSNTVLLQAFPLAKPAGETPVEQEKTKEAVLAELSEHDSSIRVYSLEADGQLSYLTAGIAGKNKTIIIQQDYQLYKLVKIDGVDKRVGILFRIEAELITKQKDVSLNGLFAIGLAVRQGSIAGQLRVQVHGLAGESVIVLIPMPTEVSESSIQNAMQAIASLKAKLYDQKVYINPKEIIAS